MTMLAPKPKLYHMGKWVTPEGDVSALCFDTPRAIDIKKASWTSRPQAVTCPKCKRLLNAQAKT